MIRKTRLIVGILFWICLTFWVANRWATQWGESSDHVTQKLARFAVMPRHQVELQFEYHQVISIGDPIYRQDKRGKLIQIGSIRQVDDPQSESYAATYTDWASATLYSTAPELRPGDYLAFHETPATMDWVLRFMLPPEKRQEIAQLIAAEYRKSSQEILDGLMPIFIRAINEASVVVREDLVTAISNRHEQWQAIGDRYRVDVVDAQLIPLLNEEILPIVQQYSRPLLERIGEQIWNRASIWRFGWRAIYDATPLPDRNLTQQEFNRFLTREAMPVIRDHLDDFLLVQQQVLREVVSSPQVQGVVRESLKEIVNDQELQNVVLDILREVIFENARLHETLESVWTSEETQNLLRMTDAKLEPTVLRIGESLFGSPTGGVTSEFARILRHKILQKDARWLVLRHDDSGQFSVAKNPRALMVVDGQSDMDNPFYYPARDR